MFTEDEREEWVQKVHKLAGGLSRVYVISITDLPIVAKKRLDVCCANRRTKERFLVEFLEIISY